MKTIANCTAVEFIRQANKIRHEISKYLDVTKIMSIRKNAPDIKESDTPEEKERKLREQSKKNLSDILDKCLDEYAEETIEILALACFKEKSEAKDMPVEELLDVAFDIIGSERVISFFSKLTKSGLISMEDTSPE